MKKVLLLATGILFLGCESTTRTNTTETEVNHSNTDESVTEGAGTEISPQLEGIEDSASRLKVDTISAAPETQPAR